MSTHTRADRWSAHSSSPRRCRRGGPSRRLLCHRPPPRHRRHLGGRESLNRAQLKAVLAHEDAHLSGHHHHMLMVLRALAATLPHLPLFAARVRLWRNYWRCAPTIPPLVASALVLYSPVCLHSPVTDLPWPKVWPRRQRRSSPAPSGWSPRRVGTCGGVTALSWLPPSPPRSPLRHSSRCFATIRRH